MSGSLREAENAVLWGCKAMCARGYVLGTAGNISARVAGEDLVVITPTSLPYEDLTADDLAVLTMEGKSAKDGRKPSIEYGMHLRILLARPDVRCIVHTHSKFATAVSAMQDVDAVPVLDIETAMYVGGDIPIAPFAPPGTEALARGAAEAIRDRAGVLLEGHGALGVGKTMRDAMVASDNIERCCEMFCIIRAAGKIKPLPPEPLKNLCDWSRKNRGIAP
ncbi:MAG: class II aldolase/adducin family protein [Deltaproteobacteria bacterium]|nr:class II aldolase/adducin family protein [Deltaproteobacteria bacterium]